MTTTATAEPVTGPWSLTRWLRRLAVALVTLLVIAGGCFGYWWAEVQTYHYTPVMPTQLYRCGNRGMREFDHAVKQSGARTIVSFVSDAELNDPKKPQFKAEAEYCRAHGLQQVRLPVPLGGWPTSDQILKFLGIVADPANRPVLMHCAQGVRRTGMFMAAYQLSVLDRTVPITKDQIATFGHKPADLDDVPLVHRPLRPGHGRPAHHHAGRPRGGGVTRAQLPTARQGPVRLARPTGRARGQGRANRRDGTGAEGAAPGGAGPSRSPTRRTRT